MDSHRSDDHPTSPFASREGGGGARQTETRPASDPGRGADTGMRRGAHSPSDQEERATVQVGRGVAPDQVAVVILAPHAGTGRARVRVVAAAASADASPVAE